MSWCPRCQQEIDSGTGLCPNCGAEVVPTPHSPVAAATGIQVVERQLLLAALQDAGIPAFTRVSDPYDAIRKTYCGTTLYGEDIYVAASDLERAQALIGSLTAGGGKWVVREMAAEIEAMPKAEDADAPQSTEEGAENPLIKFVVLAALSAVAIWLLFYLAGL